MGEIEEVLNGSRPWCVEQGDCLDVLKTLPNGCVDAVVTDPPAGIRFMGKEWDSFGGKKGNPLAEADRAAANRGFGAGLGNQPFGYSRSGSPSSHGREQFIEFLAARLTECRRVARPGAFMLCWAIPRTSHWTACAIEEAGWVIRDRITHLFGCLSDDTEILTENGWEPYHKIETGSLALAYNVDDATFDWEPIQEVLTYDYCDTAYRIHSDHTDQLVSRNHRCLVERGRGYAFQYAETLQQQASVPVLEDVRGLLEAFPLPRPHAGKAEPDMQCWVPGEAFFDGSSRRSARRASRVRPACVPDVRERAGDSGESCSIEQGNILREVLPGKSVCLTTAASLRQRQGQEATGNWHGRREESGVEGRSDNFQDAWAIHRGEIHPLPDRFPANGEERWLHHGTPTFGRTSDWASTVEDGSCASRRSRPSEQHIDQSGFVRQQQRPQTVRGARFARPDLARVTPVFYAGIVWCVRVPSGAFVARRNGKVFITGNSGFPKSKSCLKPSAEDWWLCKAPGKLQPLNVDDCRIAGDVPQVTQGVSRRAAQASAIYGQGHDVGRAPQLSSPHESGRWPANVTLEHHEECGEHCHEDCAVRLLNAQSGESGSPKGTQRPGVAVLGVMNDDSWKPRARTFEGMGDAGGASRFFFTAKASRSDRGKGNNHPTVKSAELMSWLVRLISHDGGLVLDPFAGSGSTGVACRANGRRFLGIELSSEYATLARTRIAGAVPLFDTPTLPKPAPQPTLFPEVFDA